MYKTKWKSALCILIISSIVSCSSQATIIKNDNTPIKGRIESSDKDNLYVDFFNEKITVPRNEINSIDHPGNVMGNIGLGVIGLGGVFALLGMALKETPGTSSYSQDVNETTGDIYIWTGIGIGGGGIITAIIGYSIWGRSKMAAGNMDSESARMMIRKRPRVSFNYGSYVKDNQTFYMGSVKYRF